MDKVNRAEILYRCVPNIKGFYAVIDGRLQLSSSTFNDPAQKPSVDRAKLCGSDPTHTKKRRTDGVVSFVTFSVREIADVIQNDNLGKAKFVYQIDVIPDAIKNHPTLPDNPAHALIITHPDFESKSVFKKLKESLARIASQQGWLIEPS